METKIRKGIMTQIGILTRDIERSKAAWEAFFGLPPQPINESDGYEKTQATYEGKPLNGRIRQVCFNLENIEMELIQPIGDEPSYWLDCLEKDGPGVHHISFAVKNMQGAIEQLEAEGLHTTQKGEFPNGRYAYVEARDTMNTVIELLKKDQEVFR